jgi:glycosyltransferase involved in cell wall biosynthesis
MNAIAAGQSGESVSSLVSVIIPTHRRRIYLDDALRSVAAQTYPHFETIVVNDCPEDREAVERSISELCHGRFRAVHHRQNLGVAAARNTGARAARGDILAFLDDDDFWLPTKLERHVAAHRGRPDVALIYSGFTKRWVDAIWPDAVHGAQPLPDDIVSAMEQNRFCPEHVSLITVRRASFEMVGGFDQSFRQHEDWDLFYRLAPLGFGAIADSLVLVRQHLGDRLTTAYEERREATEKLVEKWGARLNHDRFLAYYPPLAVLNTAQNQALRGRRLDAMRTLLSPQCREAEAGLLCRESVKAVMIILFGRQAAGAILRWYRDVKLDRASRRKPQDRTVADPGRAA